MAFKSGNLLIDAAQNLRAARDEDEEEVDGEEKDFDGDVDDADLFEMEDDADIEEEGVDWDRDN